jgi:signal peptide peptidase SppA
MNNFAYIKHKLNNSIWSISDESYDILAKSLDSVSGVNNAPKNNFVPDNNASPSEGNIALIPVKGILMKDVDDEAAELLWLCNIDTISEMLDKAAEDTSISEIILDFNSPGGEVTGIEELGRKILSISKIKPIKGWTSTLCASAAYWLMSQCTGGIGMTYSAKVGAVGVITQIVDESKHLEMNGIKITCVYAGKHKNFTSGNPPFTDEQMNILQDNVNKTYDKFCLDIKSARPGINDDELQGLCYTGLSALQLGLVDVCADSMEEWLSTE